ncbi:hypothetical protein ACQ4PT_024882 [Festuca glaucescens]
MDEDVVLKVLQKQRSNWQVALPFFTWAAGLPTYTHGPRTYTDMLDILGRMKKVRQMRQLFDEIPEKRCGSVVTNMMFAVLLNRYAGAHKVQEAIKMFYRRKECGFEVDLGSLADAKRVWNQIIASKLYGTFISSLTKAGKLSTAVKLFTSMWEKGINPDVAICNCIIDQLCFKKKIPEALKIFREMNGRGCQADVATYNTLVKHFSKIRRTEKVYEILDDMEKKGCSPNNMTYTYILKTTEKPGDVVNLIQRKEESGCKLDSDTYILILNLYVSMKYEKGVQHIWEEMEINGSGPDQRSFTIMVHGLHSQGKLDQALQYYTTMKSRGLNPQLKGVTDEYFADCNEEKTSKLAKSGALEKQLWEFSEELSDLPNESWKQARERECLSEYCRVCDTDDCFG